MKNWFIAVRPHTLWISVAPVLLSQVLAWVWLGRPVVSEFFLIASLCLSCAVSLQVSVNLANDYFDFFSGVDRPDREDRLACHGLLTIEQYRQGYIAALVMGVVLGIALLWISTLQLLVFGLLAVVCVLTYTSGPFPLAYHGLGEVVVLAIFGPVAVMGGFYAQVQSVPLWLWLPALQMGLLAAAIMLTNNIRDRDSDRAAGKYTIAHGLGEQGGRVLYGVLVVGSVVAALAVMGVAGFPMYLSWILVPWSALLAWLIWRTQGLAYNQQLGRTAQFMLVSALVFSGDRLIFG